MQGGERGLMKLIWRNFINSFKPQYKGPKLVGEDYYGTKYYEKPIANSTRHSRPPRYFVAVNKTDHQQEIPAEWESWLRYRRMDPPSEEELKANYTMAMIKKQNAAQIEAKNSNRNAEAPQLLLETKGQQSFPRYKEYENYGQDSETNSSSKRNGT